MHIYYAILVYLMIAEQERETIRQAEGIAAALPLMVESVRTTGDRNAAKLIE